MNLDLIKGICPIVAAPFAKDESVDYDSLRNLAATLAKGGCHALTLFGIAGEYYKLDDAEQREMMRVTIDEAHRHNVPVIVSNTRHSTANAIAFAREIEKA
ncbi:MAG: dihydrodipicolinate synthase family protein, partial [Kiritimatiellae bacterium]|nr:dihydrodipicolinate synthase family protein [Kiritimatiellia bacterium]